MTEQTKQKLKDALIEHKNIASSEYNDEDAFVGIYFCDLVDIIDNIICNTDQHPSPDELKATVGDKPCGITTEINVETMREKDEIDQAFTDMMLKGGEK